MVSTMSPMGPAPSSAPSVQTGSQAGLWAAVASGLNNQQSQQAVQAQLSLMSKRLGNRRYIMEAMKKLAPALTNGLPTQPYVAGQPLTFNLPQPNNAYARGILIRTVLNYTLAAGTGATYGLTAANSLAEFDTIEVVYNKSQIKFRPLWLRQLALMGAIEMPSIPSVGGSGYGGSQNDTTYLGPYLFTQMPTATGAQTSQHDIWIPFNILTPTEDRGLLPTMPGETGIQIKCTCAASLFGPDPVYNALYATGGTGNAISAVSGTVKVVLIYSDGETGEQPQALPYDMSILQGTIQIQQDSPLTSLVTGAAQQNRGALTILGKHKYVGCLLVDGNQSNGYAVNSNINYLSSDKDGVGANSFWRYGQGTNLDVQDYFWQERFRHGNNDLDPGVLMFWEAPLTGASDYSSRGSSYDGSAGLDNTTTGWPAWHYGIGINSQNGLGTVTPRIEPFVIYINPVGLPPV